MDLAEFYKKKANMPEDEFNRLYTKYFLYKQNINQFLEEYNVEYRKIRNKTEYEDFTLAFTKTIHHAVQFGERVKEAAKQNLAYVYKGFCIACGQEVKFICTLLPDYPNPLLSETITCPICACANRMRALLYVLHIELQHPKNMVLYTCEQITAFYRSFQKIYDFHNIVVGSEFISHELKSGTIVNGILHEDILNLSFHDESLDAVISNHVYEHVSDINKTLREAYRVLKPGGKIIAGIPFDKEKDTTFVRAKIENGEIIYFAEKEIHGNPISKEGSLAFYNFGWDLFEYFKNAGFRDVYAVNILNTHLANICDYPVLNFIAIK